MPGVRIPTTYPKEPWPSSVLMELSGDSPPMSLGKVNFTALLSETEGTVLGPQCFFQALLSGSYRRPLNPSGIGALNSFFQYVWVHMTNVFPE